ncbi:hypothetical protein [Legionella hackeliae]|uniref:Serine/threonine-protein kinase n=1 Tax=Legionella hackeliae TaxID=449 RepID=A0A0A8ULL4_LEGHA|nr:hypothetical protein [Legionella hackeliae]KTD10269.1 serine/threonine-protein kinase [Legionella hackeliae]CEK09765.1 protein of unknown function [Legionella hackeliae]STX49675.1 serine/threonine-protein kinase [Legionella hackeliae]
MQQFFNDVRQLPGNNKLNIFALFIAKLSQFACRKPDDAFLLKSLINEVKVLFHNHEQQLGVFVFTLQQNLKQYPKISDELSLFILDVIESMQLDACKEYFANESPTKDDLQCRIGRIFESYLAVDILLNPGANTWRTVNKVSINLIEFIEKNYEADAFKTFLSNLGAEEESPEAPNLALAFGHFDHKPTIEEVIGTLQESKHFARIMLIHFMFMRDVYSGFTLSSKRECTIQQFEYGGDFKKFLEKNKKGDMRYFFWNYPKFPLYSDRGRSVFVDSLSKRLGICVDEEDRAEFPMAQTAWCPDAICQEADLNSPYVQSLIARDIPYVAGPSGMTSVLSGTMLFFGQFNNLDDHHYYILAIMAFITGGGLHSIHEVLTVPHVRLGLLRNYKAFGQQAGNYNDFFSLFSSDAIISNNIDKAWKSTINWLCQRYPELVTLNINIPQNDSNQNENQRNTGCIIF